ncbi:MAG: glycosyltransferase family 4 protein [Anaerolineaceae bacterium]|nr:glycosyltransferase family 4 protein [Anaerolineaceae bacterium]
MSFDICMIVHNDITNDSRVNREATTLTNQGWRVAIVCIVLADTGKPAVETVDGYTVIRVSPGWRRGETLKTMGKLVRLLLAIPALIIHVRRTRARVVHAHDFVGLVLAALAGIWRRPVVYDSHELFFDRWAVDSKYRLRRVIQWMRPIEKMLAPRAAAVITASYESAQIMQSAMSLRNVVPILNGVDLRRREPAAVTYDTGGRTTIVHSGYLLPGRHLDEMVKSLTYLPDDIVIVLMGNGPLNEHLVELAAHLNVQDRFFIIPPVPPMSVANTLAQADVGVVLFGSDNLHQDTTIPNKFLETVAAGLPLVCGRTTALAATMNRYDLGVICDPSDPAQIAAAISQVLDPVNYARYKANALRAREELNWAVEENKLVELYHNLLGKPAVLHGDTAAVG